MIGMLYFNNTSVPMLIQNWNLKKELTSEFPPGYQYWYVTEAVMVSVLCSCSSKLPLIFLYWYFLY